jgi:hypothetical protein
MPAYGEPEAAGKTPMNIVIQKVETREFLASPPSDWVRDPRNALPFRDARHALAFCRRHHLENVRLLVFFSGNKVSLLLYIPGSETLAPTGVLKAAAA